MVRHVLIGWAELGTGADSGLPPAWPAHGAGHSPPSPLCETAIGNQSHGDAEAPGHGLASPRSASATTKPN